MLRHLTAGAIPGTSTAQRTQQHGSDGQQTCCPVPAIRCRDQSERFANDCNHVRVASKQELKDRLMAAVDSFNDDPVVHTWTNKPDWTYKPDKAA